MVVMTEHVWAVRAHMVDGACVDMLLFANENRAAEYVEQFVVLPLGFDFLEIVPRRVIGEIIDRRSAPRERPPARWPNKKENN